MTVAEGLRVLVEDGELDDAALADVLDAVLVEGTPPEQVAGFLVALRLRGEGVREIVAVARALRARMRTVAGIPAGAVDTCGTGGDGARLFNVSTAAAIVVAAAGVPVAKHGNRAVSGSVGSADVLAALGVVLELPPARLTACAQAVGIVFLHAPSLHPAMKAVAGTRRALGIRTIFNLVGPLANPAGVRRQVVGVSEPRWVDPMAEALRRLGAERAWVVHGHGGVDELTTSGPSMVAELRDGVVRRFDVDPAALGLDPGSLDVLRVVDADDSAARVHAVLAGERGPAREVVCLNAAAALVVGGAAGDLADGLARARRAIDDGSAARTLERLRAFTTGGGTA